MNQARFPESMVRFNHAVKLLGSGDLALAAQQLEEILSVEPAWTLALKLKGMLLTRQQQFEAARQLFKQVLAKQPDDLDTLINLGNLHLHCDELDSAEAVLTHALQLDPKHQAIRINLGLVFTQQHRPAQASEQFQLAQQAHPDSELASYHLGQLYSQTGNVPAALSHYARTLALNPAHLSAFNNAMLGQHYLEDFALSAALARANACGAAFARQLQPHTHWNNLAEPERVLRIGLVSGDFKDHPVGHFLLPVLKALDRSSFHLSAYQCDAAVNDELTSQLRALCAQWREVDAMSNTSFAAQVQRDQIDILIDLAGHTANNRLDTFALKPAPVQVSWLGYFSTTGLSAVDYLLTDHVSSPEDESAGYSETLWHLPEARLPLFKPAISKLSPLPCLAPDTPFTFGSFQSTDKINSRVLRCWAQILNRCPASRLRLQSPSLNTLPQRQGFSARLSAAGIAQERYLLYPATDFKGYLHAHEAIDMILDTYPYPGGAKTNLALWQGVPTLTLSSPGILGRQGEMLLRAAGLPDWVCQSEAAYIETAVQYGSRDPAAIARLTHLRQTLPENLSRQPAADVAQFAEHLGQALRSMWQRYCQKPQVSAPESGY